MVSYKANLIDILCVFDYFSSGKENGKNTRYLVKWRDLGYEDCTWELPSMLPAGLEDWDKYYKAYWDHR